MYVSSEEQTLPSYHLPSQGLSSTMREKSATDNGGLHLFDGFAEFSEFKKSKSSVNLALPPTIPEEEMISEDKPLIGSGPGSSISVHCSTDPGGDKK